MEPSTGEEEWRDIKDPCIPDRYQVSNVGRVRSVDARCLHNEKRTRFAKGRIIRAHKAGSGYSQVSLSGTFKHFYIHRLVAEYFIGKIPKGREINHKDGNKLNNTVSNLEIVTPSENLLHRHRVLGQKVHNQKLNKEKATEIRKIYKGGGISQKKLAEQFGVTTMTVCRIINNVQWYAKI